MLKDPHFAAREAILTLPHPRWGEISMQNVFPKLSETPGSVRALAPQSVGEHNADILGGRLGLSPDDLQHLSREGII
jgi:formyl-CoA transferase